MPGKGRKRAKPKVIRLYPESPRGLYVEVCVWPTRRDMIDFGNREGVRTGRGCQGWCTDLRVIRVRRREPDRLRPVFAEVHLHADALTMNVVTHELFHATTAWGRRIGFDWNRLHAEDSINEDEERLAYAHCRMCSDFVTRATALGFY